MKRALYVIVFVLTGPGCIHQIALNSIGDIVDTGFEVLNEEQDLSLAGASIASNLKLLETIIRDDPDNRHYLLLASESYSSYALAFVEDDSVERAKLFYLRGKEFGLRILNRNRAFADAQHKGIEHLRSSMASFSNEDVPAVFWTAVGWGSYISHSLNDPEALADLPKVEEMMHFVLSRDSIYFYAGAHCFLGTLDGSRPNMLGGDLDASRDHFERCLRINGGKFLMSYIFYARSYAVQMQDKELFRSLLHSVDTTSIDVLPEQRLSNAVAKWKARRMEAKIDESF